VIRVLQDSLLLSAAVDGICTSLAGAGSYEQRLHGAAQSLERASTDSGNVAIVAACACWRHTLDEVRALAPSGSIADLALALQSTDGLLARYTLTADERLRLLERAQVIRVLLQRP